MWLAFLIGPSLMYIEVEQEKKCTKPDMVLAGFYTNQSIELESVSQLSLSFTELVQAPFFNH